MTDWLTYCLTDQLTNNWLKPIDWQTDCWLIEGYPPYPGSSFPWTSGWETSDPGMIWFGSLKISDFGLNQHALLSNAWPMNSLVFYFCPFWLFFMPIKTNPVTELLCITRFAKPVQKVMKTRDTRLIEGQTDRWMDWHWPAVCEAAWLYCSVTVLPCSGLCLLDFPSHTRPWQPINIVHTFNETIWTCNWITLQETAQHSS